MREVCDTRRQRHQHCTSGVADSHNGVADMARRRLSAERKWMLISGAASLAGSFVAGTLLDSGWRKTTGRRLPENPASPHTSWKEAIGWALVTGAATSLVSMLAVRGAATGWQRRTGHLPRELSRKRL